MNDQEILNVFEQLGLASEVERNKFRSLESIAKVGVVGEGEVDEPSKILFGGPAEHFGQQGATLNA